MEETQKKLEAGDINTWAYEIRGCMFQLTSAIISKLDTLDSKYLNEKREQIYSEVQKLGKDMTDEQQTRDSDFLVEELASDVIDKVYPPDDSGTIGGVPKPKKAELTENEEFIYNEIKEGIYKGTRNYPDIGKRDTISDILQSLQAKKMIRKKGKEFGTEFEDAN